MSSKNAKKSEQRKSNQQQIEQAQAQPEQQNQPTAVIPPQAYQNQTQYQYVYVNYSRRSNVIGLSIVYAISLFLTIGLPIGLFSMNGSMKDFSSEANYYLIQVVKIVMPIILALSVISSIILWIAYLPSKNKIVAKIAAACTLSISVISFVVFWIYLNFYSVVGFGDAAFFLPIPFGVMILGIAWCVNVFKYQNENILISHRSTNIRCSNNQLNTHNNQLNIRRSSQSSIPSSKAKRFIRPVSQQYPQNNVQYPYDYNKK